ncbi:MAG TPA: indolepyruvate oxidoreductase subunit beta [Sedimentisphaerales bacterium]|nr:indolepyruvate oxidoreductase subunit beta [Sedimentisphaerales bacterium]
MKTTRIMIVAVGGQGNILAARLLGEAATAAGITPRMSEFHGMAQRGGVVESMVLLGDGKGYCIADGTADVLLGFEPSETIRAAKKCGAHTVIVSNTSPQPPFTVAMGKAQYFQVDAALAALAGRAKRLVAFDATALALTAGSPLSMNMVMLGGLVQTGILPIPADVFRRVIAEKTKAALVAVNLQAFDLGMRAAEQGAVG